MKRSHNNIFIALLAMLVFSSCRDEVILDLNTVGPIVVIEGKISNDSVPFWIKVTTTADYYSPKIPLVTDAVVTISGSDGSKDTLFHALYKDTIRQSLTGYYFSKHVRSCKVGIAYTLNVTYNGKTYSATETCLTQNPVDSIKAIFQPKKGFLPAGYYFWEYTTEKPGKGDCYQWELFQNDTNIYDDYYYLADDQFLEDNGQQLSSDFQYPFRSGDSIIFEQHAISRQFYNFLTAVQSQSNRDGSPFSAPPSNIGGNLSNGALGYFAVRNTIRKKLVVK